MNTESLMTADEVAGLLKIRRQMVYRLTRQKKLQFYRIGERDLRFSHQHVLDYLKAQEGRANGET